MAMRAAIVMVKVRDATETKSKPGGSILDNQFVDERLFCERNNIMQVYQHWIEVEKMLGYKISYAIYTRLTQRFRLENVNCLTSHQKTNLQAQILAYLYETQMLFELTEERK